MDNVCKIPSAGDGAPSARRGKRFHLLRRAAQALKNVSLEVHPHEVVAILGSNGAGKTTLLKTITGLLTPRERADPL